MIGERLQAYVLGSSRRARFPERELPKGSSLAPGNDSRFIRTGASQTENWQDACWSSGMGARTWFIMLVLVGLMTAGCSRGGRSPHWNRQTIVQKQPPPGYGQTGPGMTARVNQINGPDDSSY